MINIGEVNNCLGCMGCQTICPTKAITFKENAFGDLYPRVEQSKCIKCGLCLSSCPAVKSVRSNVQAVFSFALKKDVMKSASGGAGHYLARKFFEQGYQVFGAILDENNNCYHCKIKSEQDLDLIRKSKYIKSDTTFAFSEIANLLKNGEKVAFFGTPCQVSFVKNHFQHPYKEQLILIDILCHGAPNNTVFKEYIKFEENRYSQKIKSFTFRTKKPRCVHSFSIEFEHGRKNGYWFESPYYLAFKEYAILRDECYGCPYKSNKRCGDITIGDFWGPHDRRINKIKGASLIAVNNPAFMPLFECENKKVLLVKEAIDNAYINNSALSTSQIDTPYAAAKKNNESIVQKGSFEMLFKKYVPKRITLLKFKQKIPNCIKHLYHRFLISK